MVTSLSISDFNYELPDASVAKYPLPERDQSRLLVWKNGEIADHFFFNLPELLPEGSMLIFNNTRVIHARLQFTKTTGAKIEVFCLEPTFPNDYVLSFAQTNSCLWKCLVGNLKRWKGEVLEMKMVMETGERRRENGDGRRENGDGRTENGDGRTENGDGRTEIGETQTPGDGEDGKSACREVACSVFPTIVLKAELIGELEGGFEVKFSWDNPRFSFGEILEAAGNIPIPPYLHRESEEIDLTVYQTVYSKIKGSVAAPTAGLHFTDRVFNELASRDIACAELTLHVGAGTFQPVKSDSIGEHQMHAEYFSVACSLISRLITHQESLIAVGTTSVRTLESLYWIGCKIVKNPHIEPNQLSVAQWEPYQEVAGKIEAKAALQAILDWMAAKDLTSLETSTQIMILPGYQFRIISGLVTNFHQPQSTLLLLISAILGEDWKRVYTHALNSGYRFLSYGDSNLYWLGERLNDLTTERLNDLTT
jgi:S-adenosylmethionine:tRNA ribosyltransferase-isomerase